MVSSEFCSQTAGRVVKLDARAMCCCCKRVLLSSRSLSPDLLDGLVLFPPCPASSVRQFALIPPFAAATSPALPSNHVFFGHGREQVPEMSPPQE